LGIYELIVILQFNNGIKDIYICYKDIRILLLDYIMDISTMIIFILFIVILIIYQY